MPTRKIENIIKKLKKKRKTTVDISEGLKKTWSTVDFSALKNKPYINFDINLDLTDEGKRENIIMDLIQQNFCPIMIDFMLNMKIELRRKKTNKYLKLQTQTISWNKIHLNATEEMQKTIRKEKKVKKFGRN